MDTNTIKAEHRIIELGGAFFIDRLESAYGPTLDVEVMLTPFPDRQCAEQALNDAASLAFAGWLSDCVATHERHELNRTLGYDPSFGLAEERSGWEFK